MNFKIFKFKYINDNDGSLIPKIEKVSQDILLIKNEFKTQKAAFIYLEKNQGLWPNTEFVILPYFCFEPKYDEDTLTNLIHRMDG